VSILNLQKKGGEDVRHCKGRYPRGEIGSALNQVLCRFSIRTMEYKMGISEDELETNTPPPNLCY